MISMCMLGMHVDTCTSVLTYLHVNTQTYIEDVYVTRAQVTEIGAWTVPK